MAREMKDSGIEWIGEIPAEWKIKKIKKTYKILGGSGFKDIFQGNTKGKYPVCKAGDISNAGKYLVTSSNYVSEEVATKIGFNIIPSGSIIYAKIGEAMKKNNRSLTQVECCLDNNCQAMVPIDMDKLYSYYLFSCIDMRWFDNAGTIPSVNNKLLNNEYISCPNLNIQQKIADFLDKKCSQIDTALEKTRTTIEEYKKLKQAIITKAVTKGIRGDRPMKDSGIEWIGEIPVEWDIIKFKFIAQVKANLVAPDNYQEYPQISPDNIEKDSGILLNFNTVAEAGVVSDNHLFFKEQILYSKIRPALNKVIIAPFDGLCSADMYPIDTIYDSKMLQYIMLSSVFVEQTVLVTRNRVKMPKLNKEELGQVIIANIPIEEQQEIVDYLDKKCAAIDTLIAKKEQLITDLESYKKSLIYEYVTGKKEVC